ncbi:hypothetical protein HK102_003445, partial [Quaeritorhiza haematococci]
FGGWNTSTEDGQHMHREFASQALSDVPALVNVDTTYVKKPQRHQQMGCCPR